MKHEINVPEGCKVVSVETTDEMVVVKFEKDEPKFKENDIVFLDSVESVMIFDYIDDSDVIHTKCFYSTLQNKLSTKTINVCGKMRLATDSEKQLLFDKLKENDKPTYHSILQQLITEIKSDGYIIIEPRNLSEEIELETLLETYDRI